MELVPRVLVALQTKTPWMSLTNRGRGWYHEDRKGRCYKRLARVDQLKSAFMLTVWGPAKRSTCFYRKYVDQYDQAYKNSQE